jgi:hypothetical protein
MIQTGLVFILFFVRISVAGNVYADDLSKSAMTAAPTSISVKATEMDWNFKTVGLGKCGRIHPMHIS